MKCLVLRPRNRDYFSRGVGWAGKIKTADGQLIYDSVANNSAAHYLFNMMFLMGEEGQAAEAYDISAELLRGNPIENFDTSKISFKMLNGAKACFIAAHPVNKGIEPVFEYQFEKGTVYYANESIDASYGLMPEDYTEYGQIVAYMNDGTKTAYGDPMSNNCKKMHDAVQAIKQEFLKEENGFLYADGLFEACIDCYKDTEVSIVRFGCDTSETA